MTSGSSKSSDSGQEQFDIAPLSWVITELREALTSAGKLLVDAIAQDADAQATTLLQAKAYLHQAHGALQIVEVEGVAIVTETVEELIERIQAGKLENSQSTIDKMTDAFYAILRYLEDLLAGNRQQPVRLYPEYRALLELKGAERIHPADLFFPSLSVQEKIPELALAASPRRVDFSATRLRFEKLLLTVLTSKSVDAQHDAASHMASLIREIEQVQTTSQTKAFWLVMRAFAESTVEVDKKNERHVKQIWGRINLQIRRLVEGNSSVPERLLRDALFFIAQVQTPSPFVAQIRKAYQLENHVPDDYDQKKYGLIPPHVLANAKEQLSNVKNMWGRISNGDSGLNEKFSQKMKDLAETGTFLHTPSLAKLLVDLNSIVSQVSNANDQQRMGLELATCLLFIENSLDQITHLPANFSARAEEIFARLRSVVAGEVPENQATWIGEISREAQQRQTMGVLVGEMQASLKQAEKALDEHFRDTSNVSILAPVDNVLSQIGGALAILDQDDAMHAVVYTRGLVKEFIQGNEGKEQAEITSNFQKVAQNVGALSFFIETLQSQPEFAKTRFSFNANDGLFHSRLLEKGPEKELLPSVPLETSHLHLQDHVSTMSNTAEQDLIEQQKESERLLASLVEAPQDQSLQVQLKDSLDNERSFAALLDDGEASTRAKTAIDLLAQTDFTQPTAALGEIVAATTNVVTSPEIQLSQELPETEAEIDAELLEIFLMEADEVLGAVRENIPLSRNDSANQEYLIRLRRSFHTLKGSGRMVGLNVFGEAAWNIEQVMNMWLSDSRSGSDTLFMLLEYAANELFDWVEELKTKGSSHRSADAIIAAALRVRDGGVFVLDEPVVESGTKLEAAVPTAVDVTPEVVSEEPVIATHDDVETQVEAVGDAPTVELADEIAFAAEYKEVDIPPLDAVSEVILLETETPLTDVDFVSADEPVEAFDEAFIMVSETPEIHELDIEVPILEQVLDLNDIENANNEVVDTVFVDILAEQLTDAEPSPVEEVPSSTAQIIEFPDFTIPISQELDNTKRIGEVEISLPLHTIYMAETDEIVRFLAQDFAEWRHEPNRQVTRHAVHAAHSLAGSSATVGLYAAQEIAHNLENVLQRLERHHVDLEDAEFDLLDHVVDCVKLMLQKFALSEMAERVPVENQQLSHLLEAVVTRSNVGNDEEFITSTNEYVDPIILDVQVQNPLSNISESSDVNVDTAVPDPVQLPEDQAQSVPLVLNEPTDVIINSAAIEGSNSKLQAAPERVEVQQNTSEIDLKVSDEIDSDLLPVFIEEGNDLLPMIGQLLSSWKQAPEDDAIPQSILRLMHTVKGSARMAGAMQLGQHTHDMETRIENLMQVGSALRQPLLEDLIARHDYAMHLFERLQNPGAAISAPVVSVAEPSIVQDIDRFQDALQAAAMAEAADIVKALADEKLSVARDITPENTLENVQESTKLVEAESSDTASTVEQKGEVGRSQEQTLPAQSPTVVSTAASVPKVVRQAVPQAMTSSNAAPVPLVRVRADILDRLVNQAGEVSISRSKLENEVFTLKASLSELTENVSRLRDQLREVEIQAETQITSRMALSGDREFDPLEFDRFTRLQELTRMMAESVSDVASVQTTLHRTIEGATSDLHTQARLTRELQQDLMRVRMIPFSSVSERLYRIARQTAKEVDKRVNLDIRGTSVEIDRSVLEKMVGPFEHMLRNAIVHGIESRQDRVGRGKNEVGELLIEIRQEGNEVVIHFTDDGQGLNLGRIREKAKTVGLLTDESYMNESDVVNLIFEPGFSTASEVTELAGRGVGMDVVRSEAASLGGRVSVASVEGKGAHFTIHLPLTLAVTQVVILNAGGKTYAVPSVLVEQVQQLKSAALATAYNDGAIIWHGNRVAMHYLPSMLGQRDATPDTQQYTPILIMKSDDERVAIHVDQIIGNREVVVKNVGPQLARMIGIAGATVLGSGDIVLILNPVPLAQRMEYERAKLVEAREEITTPEMGAVAEMQEKEAIVAPVQGLRSNHIVMVVDDSLTVRRVTQRLLVREGYQVVLAKDGIDALEQLQSITPDVMLVDIEMPRMDGFDLTRNVRSDSRTSHIPIIMITSRTADKHRNYATELGVNEYFGKPYREDDLLAAITRFVNNQVANV